MCLYIAIIARFLFYGNGMATIAIEVICQFDLRITYIFTWAFNWFVGDSCECCRITYAVRETASIQARGKEANFSRTGCSHGPQMVVGERSGETSSQKKIHKEEQQTNDRNTTPTATGSDPPLTETHATKTKYGIHHNSFQAEIQTTT